MLYGVIIHQRIHASHGIVNRAEYLIFIQKQKAKEFFNQIISLENPNPDIRLQAVKRLNRDLSE